jgi:hypothetical protein
MPNPPRRRDAMPLHSVYLTASDLGLDFGLETRKQMWSHVPREHALVLLASMLAETDTNGQLAGARKDVHGNWASRIHEHALRQRVQIGLTLHNVLIASQLVVIAIREAIEHCEAGPPRFNDDYLDVLIACILGIGDEEQAGRRQGNTDEWAGLDPVLAADLVSNIHFNRSVALHHLMAHADSTWTQPWPDLTPIKDRRAAGGEPAELFLEATGVTPQVLQQVTVHLYVQYMRNGHLVFPAEFFDKAGINSDELEKVLDLICADAASLAADFGHGSSGWEFNPLRRRPLLRLEDGRILVLRLAWLMERVLSDVTYFDIRQHLKQLDAADGTRRDDAFRRCVQAKLEADTGAALTRMFDRKGGRVWHEHDLQAAWGPSFRKGLQPKVCDFVVQVGHYWLLVDATDRAMPTDVVAGLSGATGLDVELERVLTGRKAKQLQSTVELLREHMHDLTGAPTDPEAVFIPIVATPSGGLPWMHVVGVEAAKQLVVSGLLQDDDVLPPALMDPKDLSLLENQSESQGVRAIETVAAWRRGPWTYWGFDAHLHQSGKRLSATRRERQASARILNNAVRTSKANFARRSQ